MSEAKTRRRLTETVLGRLMAFLLAAGWIVIMAVVDGNAYTALPMCVLCAVVALCYAVALLQGGKVVRFTWLAWFGLGVGVYYLVRALMSYSVVEGWGQAALVSACMVYYVAGIYAAQGKLRVAFGALAAAVLANIVYYYLMQVAEADIIWTGRPAVSLVGENTRPCGLFYYKNFAGLFLMLGGVLLLARGLFHGGKKGWVAAACLLGAAAVALSFFCRTFSHVIAGSVLLLTGWCLWCVQRLYSPKPFGVLPVLVSMVLVVVLCIAGYSLLFGDLLQFINEDLDTHLRFQIWGDLTRVVQDAPWWGYGAGASQWEIISFFDEWVVPNYAHNEYLQAWVDYGVLGLLLMLGVLAAHLVCGFWALGSEETGEDRRRASALALLVLAALSVCALSDYVWHHAALATMMAFACGILASPFRRHRLALPGRRKWADDRHHALIEVKTAGIAVRCVLGTGAVAVAVFEGSMSMHFLAPWQAQWRFQPVDTLNEKAMKQQFSMAEELLPGYPDFRLFNYCVRGMLPYQVDWSEHLPALLITLRGNPRNLLIVSTAADMLTHMGRFSDAELLMRRFYEGDGPDPTRVASWHAHYGRNLLMWGLHECRRGEVEAGFSKLRYGFNIATHRGVNRVTLWRSDRTWKEESMDSRYYGFLNFCRQQINLYEKLGVQANDSWMQPMEPGGKPALYQRWGKAPKNRSTKK